MKKEERVNKYLEIVFKNFRDIADKGINRCLLSSKYLMGTIDVEPSSKGVQKVEIPNRVLLNCTRVIINDIDPNLVDKYDSFVDEKNIIIKKSEIYDLFKEHRAYYDRSYKNGKSPRIVMYKHPDFYAVSTLIHEFMHSTNTKRIDKENPLDQKDILRNELSEFVSIYFEMYAREYLINRLNVNNNMIDLSERFISNYELANHDLEECISYVIYDKYGTVNYENYLTILDEYKIPLLPNKMDYNSSLNRFIKSTKKIYNSMIEFSTIKKDEDGYDIVSDLLHKYLTAKITEDNYIASTMLYFSIKDRLTKEDILKFNKVLGDDTSIEDKFLNPDFSKVIEYYNNLLNNEELDNKIDNFLKSVYDEKGKIKKL